MTNSETRRSPLRANQFAVPGGTPEVGPADFTKAEAASRTANLGRSNYVSPGYVDHFAPEAVKAPAKPGMLLRSAGTLGKVAPWVGAGMEARDVYKVAQDPKATKLDVATQTAEGISKLAGAAAGAGLGAAAGGPLAPLTGLAGGVAGYYAPELATKGLRWAADKTNISPGLDTSSPVDRTDARAAAARGGLRPAPAALAAAPQTQQGPFTESFEKKMAALPSVQSLRAGTPEAAAASAQMDSGMGYIPGQGEGMVRNSNGDVVRFKSAPPTPVSADYLRRQYAPTVYDDTNASWKHTDMRAPSASGPTSTPTGWIDQLIGLRQARAAADRDVTKRGQDLANSATLRGQDLSENQSIRTNDTARWTGERSLAQNLRQMQWDRQKFGIEQEMKQNEFDHKVDVDTRTGREAANTAMFNQFKNSLPPVKDPKTGEMVPDVQGANAHMAAAQAAMANRVSALRQRGDPASLQQAAQLEAQGPAGLGQNTIQDILDGMDMKRRVDTRLGQLFFNGGASGQTSNDPMTYLIDKEATAKLGDPKLVVTRGGHTISMNDVAREQLGNRILPDFDTFNPRSSRHLRQQ